MSKRAIWVQMWSLVKNEREKREKRIISVIERNAEIGVKLVEKANCRVS